MCLCFEIKFKIKNIKKKLKNQLKDSGGKLGMRVRKGGGLFMLEG